VQGTRLAAPEAAAAGRGPPVPAQQRGRRRVPLVGVPERAHDAMDLRRGHRVSNPTLESLFPVCVGTRQCHVMDAIHLLQKGLAFCSLNKSFFYLISCLASARCFASEDSNLIYLQVLKC
jgi:hypothetical protein